MKTIKSYTLLFCCSIFFVLASCNKFVEIDGPKNQLANGAVFSDSTNASAAVTGIYINMMQPIGYAFTSGALSIYPGLSSDELYLSFNDVAAEQIFNNQINPTNDKNLSLYNFAYKYIYQSNASVEGISASPAISESAKSKLIAEARFLRAFFYFNLINIYGQVPLIMTTDYNISRSMPNASVDQVYEQIFSDLKFAQTNLSPDMNSKDRANFYAATALLAKCYLYRGQYSYALKEADKIILSGKYTIVTNPDDVFLPTSNETIWDLRPVLYNLATFEGQYFVPTSSTAIPRFVITNDLYNTFEKNDLRKASWIKVNTVSGVEYPYPYKYKVTNSTTVVESSVVFRLAEIYLIRAEAEASLNNLEGSKTDLNVIRSRAGLSNTAAVDKITLLNAIESERQKELFCEWGNRWFDLKRTDRAVQVLGVSKPDITGNSLLYPIPRSEINANPNLTQNPGY
jgi:hypothetical protein